ncbi:hypothetical protein NDU88_004775 [Pleurodeles waltl]|uniref:Uncharacterized protein n=1 Tax=Pleurodeles waltl TaxID=8319 RepID=A0AAV7V5E1_PLEWA|nr:hypothetical protein NDU88_004775 [Pleurodeles waltl]
MFKAPQPVEVLADNTDKKSPNSDHLQTSAAAVTEARGDSSNPVSMVTSVPTTFEDSELSQMDDTNAENGLLGQSNTVRGLSLDSLCLAMSNISGNEQRALSKEKIHQKLQDIAVVKTVKQHQNSQVVLQGLMSTGAAGIVIAEEKLAASACTLPAPRNPCNFQQGKEDNHVAGEGGENFYSDVSRDLDDAGSSFSMDSEIGSNLSAPSSMLRQTAIKCPGGRGDRDVEKMKKNRIKRKGRGREQCPGTIREHNKSRT